MTKYPKEYFEIQIRFAERWSQISGKPFLLCLRDETSLYKRLYEKSHNGTNVDPEWDALLSSVEDTTPTHAVLDLVYNAYLKQPRNSFGYHVEQIKHFGPFRYVYNEKLGDIRIHFGNKGVGAKSDLAKENLRERLADLIAMFQDIAEKHPDAKQVVGYSWLYNVEAYRRLFPEAFLETAHKADLHDSYFRTDAVWGQFLNAQREVKPEMMETFLKKIREAQSIGELQEAFPYQALNPVYPIVEFYKFYDIGSNAGEI